MLEVPCPWCDGPMVVGDRARLDCDACGIAIDIAPDAAEVLAAAA